MQFKRRNETVKSQHEAFSALQYIMDSQLDIILLSLTIINIHYH